MNIPSPSGTSYGPSIERLVRIGPHQTGLDLRIGRYALGLKTGSSHRICRYESDVKACLGGSGATDTAASTVCMPNKFSIATTIAIVIGRPI